MKKAIIILTLLIVVSTFYVLLASAHSTSQEGILEKEFINRENYMDYYIGGESVGWSIDEGCHIGHTTIRYRFDGVADAIKSIFRAGASMWDSIVDISETAGATGVIQAYDFNTPWVLGGFGECYVYSTTGHLASWEIELNTNGIAPISEMTVAHELGHVIGLNDLYADYNTSKLMYHNAAYTTATAPTSSDIWGAKVILGIHTTHSFDEYRYWGTDSSGVHYHVQYCSDCNGNRATKSRCTVSTSNLTQCLKCGFSLNQT